MKHEEVLVDNEHSATFKFDTYLEDTLSLCYKYNSEEYFKITFITLTLKQITSMTSIQSEEKSDLAVVDLTKSVQFHGTGISSDQSDHARWVKGDSCEMNIVPLFSTSSIDLSLYPFVLFIAASHISIPFNLSFIIFILAFIYCSRALISAY